MYKLNSTISLTVVETLKSCFSQFGIPEIVFCDNGPQFTSDSFSQFAKTYDFQHVTSSPFYPQSNGLAERTVQTVKALLMDAEDPHMALLTYRSTLFPWCMLSPAELLMGRRLRTNVPIPPTQLIPEWTYVGEFRQLDLAFKRKQKENYEVCSQPQLSTDSDVWITSGREPIKGSIVEPAAAPRSHLVETPSGRIRRNRRHSNINPKKGTVETSRQMEQVSNAESNQEQTEEPTAPATVGPEPIREPIMTRSRTGAPINPPERFGKHSRTNCNKGRCRMTVMVMFPLSQLSCTGLVVVSLWFYTLLYPLPLVVSLSL